MDCARHLSGLFFRPRSNAGAGSVFATRLLLPNSGAFNRNRRFAMNKDQVKGTAEKVKGKVNEAVGNVTDDPAQKAKGQVQQGVGEAQKQYGDLKEDVKKGKA
jgi:uncharacterized protein YjbJ (UPF0337 family)